MRGQLFKKLAQYAETDFYPLHMPGHKRNENFKIPGYRWDITEIEGFDNLHHAEGILKEIQENAAKLFGSEETHFLINGSTAGILAAVSGCVKRGGTILAARNCHKAVYHAVYLRNLNCRYLYPEPVAEPVINGGIYPEQVREELEAHPEIEAVILTSPTYEGIVSDIQKIAEMVHEKGIPLIVDEAHGAHFGMSPRFPKSSVQCQADVVIQSLHKTLPAPTQSAVLHLNGTYVNRDKIRKFLEIYQTSSPSYLMMGAMDACVHIMQKEGGTLLEELYRKASFLRREDEKRKRIRIPGKELISGNAVFGLDLSRILITDTLHRLTGKELSEILRETYHLETEMAQEDYCLAILTVGDTWEGIKRLNSALCRLDEELSRKDEKTAERQYYKRTEGMIKNETICTMAEAEEGEVETIRMDQATGRVSAEFFFLYPPGIPLAVPGERISEALCEQIQRFRERGFAIQGTADPNGVWLKVMKEKEKQ